MKKLALTSLLAVFAVSAANAGVIDGNPLYRPSENHFYSVTDVNSHSESTETWKLAEEFGYGITDYLAVILTTDFSESDWFEPTSWNDFGLELNGRVLDMGGWKADLYGKYEFGTIWGATDGFMNGSFLNEDATEYTWTAGMRGGYVGEGWTVAGHVAYNYRNIESFNWNDKGLHLLAVGVDGQLMLPYDFNLVAGVEYTGALDNHNGTNQGSWTGTFGVNYNIDPTKFVGVYVDGELGHKVANDGDIENGWEVKDGFGFGFKFGIDF